MHLEIMPTSPSSLPSTPEETKSLEYCIRSRHSIRYFLPDPVPKQILDHCLSLAQLAASNSNTQPWRLFLATGAVRDRISSTLLSHAKQYGPNIPSVPEAFQHFRSAFGKLLYGPNGYDIARDDTAARATATLRNYEFFGAPVVGVICMPKCMGLIDAMGVGMWLQTLNLALVEQGLGTCAQVSVTGYPEVLREEFGIGDELEILCGIAIGWPDKEQKVNGIVTGRQKFGKCVVTVGE